jgi:hypothetical protein
VAKRVETVKNVASHPVDLRSGRVLAPGEVAEDVELVGSDREAEERGDLAVVNGKPAPKQEAPADDAPAVTPEVNP